MPPAKRQRVASPSEASEELELDRPVQWQVRYPKLRADGSLMKSEACYKNYISLHVSPFSAKFDNRSLNLNHVILPLRQWSGLKKYSKFIIQGEEYASDEFVWVKPANCKTQDDQMTEKDFWVARVLEVRAIDAAHVYAKLVWMYWPDELPKTLDAVTGVTATGRRPCHGEHEVIASNYMDIIDVTCFAGKAPVQHWTEDDDEDKQTGLYWRQTYNFQTSRLSSVRLHCTCQQPYNPDLKMFQCGAGTCSIWLHEKCIIEKHLEKAWNLLSVVNPSVTVDSSTIDKSISITTTVPSKSSKGGKTSKVKAKSFNSPWGNLLDGAITQEGDDPPLVTIKSLTEGTQWEEDLLCLKCGVPIV